MTFVVVVSAAYLAWITVCAPWLAARRARRRVLLTDARRIAPARRAVADRHDVTTPRFTRDPSPRPKPLGDWDYRAWAEGENL